MRRENYWHWCTSHKDSRKSTITREERSADGVWKERQSRFLTSSTLQPNCSKRCTMPRDSLTKMRQNYARRSGAPISNMTTWTKSHRVRSSSLSGRVCTVCLINSNQPRLSFSLLHTTLASTRDFSNLLCWNACSLRLITLPSLLPKTTESQGTSDHLQCGIKQINNKFNSRSNLRNECAIWPNQAI